MSSGGGGVRADTCWLVAGRCQPSQMLNSLRRRGSHRRCRSSTETITPRLQPLQLQRQACRCVFAKHSLGRLVHCCPYDLNHTQSVLMDCPDGQASRFDIHNSWASTNGAAEHGHTGVGLASKADTSDPADELPTAVVAAVRVPTDKAKDSRVRGHDARKSSRMSVMARPSECAHHAAAPTVCCDTCCECMRVRFPVATESSTCARAALIPREAARSTGQGMRSTRASVAGGYRDGTDSVAGSKRGSMAGGAASSHPQATAAALAAAGEVSDLPCHLAFMPAAPSTATLYWSAAAP